MITILGILLFVVGLWAWHATSWLAGMTGLEAANFPVTVKPAITKLAFPIAAAVGLAVAIVSAFF